MIDAIIMLADRYFLLIHKAISLFLPSPLLARLEKRNYVLETPHIEARAPSSSVAIHHFISHTFSPLDLSEHLTDGSVIIFASDMMLRVFMHSVETDSTILILPSYATTTKKSQAWIDIYERKYRIIV
jgi:hypothetical protein